jgi:predicted ATP-grasp superfamily ATP-dependent carboligase
MSNPPVAVLWGDLNMLRCFSSTSVPTLVVTSSPEEPVLRSRHCRSARVITSPKSDPDRALEDLVSVSGDLAERAPLFFGDDTALLLVSRNRATLAPRFRLDLPEADLIEALVDKSSFARLASERDLPVPPTFVWPDDFRAPTDLGDIGFPCFVKPDNHVGWLRSLPVRRAGGVPRKGLRVDDPSELARVCEEMHTFTPRFVVQPFIGGGRTSVLSYHAYVDPSGHVLGEFAGQKVRAYPSEVGISTYLELVAEPSVLATGRQVVERLGLTGPMKMDFKRDDRTGALYLLEINPRWTLWNHLGAACGVNLPLLAYERLAREGGEIDPTGLPPAPPPPYRTDIRWLSFPNDVRTVLNDVRTGVDVSFLSWLASYRSEKVYDVFAWDDPLPLLFSAFSYSKAVGRRITRRNVALPAGAPGGNA